MLTVIIVLFVVGLSLIGIISKSNRKYDKVSEILVNYPVSYFNGVVSWVSNLLNNIDLYLTEIKNSLEIEKNKIFLKIVLSLMFYVSLASEFLLVFNLISGIELINFSFEVLSAITLFSNFILNVSSNNETKKKNFNHYLIISVFMALALQRGLLYLEGNEESLIKDSSIIINWLTLYFVLVTTFLTLISLNTHYSEFVFGINIFVFMIISLFLYCFVKSLKHICSLIDQMITLCFNHMRAILLGIMMFFENETPETNTIENDVKNEEITNSDDLITDNVENEEEEYYNPYLYDSVSNPLFERFNTEVKNEEIS